MRFNKRHHSQSATKSEIQICHLFPEQRSDHQLSDHPDRLRSLKSNVRNGKKHEREATGDVVGEQRKFICFPAKFSVAPAMSARVAGNSKPFPRSPPPFPHNPRAAP